MHSLSGFSVSKRWDIFSVCGNFGQSSEILQNTPIPEDPSTLIHASENVHLNIPHVRLSSYPVHGDTWAALS